MHGHDTKRQGGSAGRQYEQVAGGTRTWRPRARVAASEGSRREMSSERVSPRVSCTQPTTRRLYVILFLAMSHQPAKSISHRPALGPNTGEPAHTSHISVGATGRHAVATTPEHQQPGPMLQLPAQRAVGGVACLCLQHGAQQPGAAPHVQILDRGSAQRAPAPAPARSRRGQAGRGACQHAAWRRVGGLGLGGVGFRV